MPYDEAEMRKWIRRRVPREDLEDLALAVVTAIWPPGEDRDEQWNGGDICELVSSAIDTAKLCPYASTLGIIVKAKEHA